MKYQTYEDRFYKGDSLTGLRGNSFLEPGYVHAPYIPAIPSSDDYTKLKKKLRSSGLKTKQKSRNPCGEIELAQAEVCKL